MTTLEQPAQPGERLAPVRRTYVYIVAFVSLAVTLVGVSGLIDTLLRMWLDRETSAYGTGVFSRGLASNIGLLLVATPIFLIHWSLAQRHRLEAAERASLLRKGFLYAATAWSLASMLANAAMLIFSMAELAVGLPPSDAGTLPAEWTVAGLQIVINAALVAYWYSILQSDGDFGAESTSGRIVRQIFMLFAGLVGLGLLLWGAANLIQLGLRLLVDVASPSVGSSWWRRLIAEILTQLLVGGWLAYNNRAQWQAIIAQHPNEGKTALRRLYLYLAVFIGAVTALTPAALILRELLLMVFGDTVGSLPLLMNRMITPVSYVPVGIFIWLWHWNVLRREAAAFGESHQSATVRRIYFYLMAATGLGLLWVGGVSLLHTLLDLLLSRGASSGGLWHEPLANGLSLLAVGAPIWALHWRSAQAVATRADAAGDAERDALPRKLYLYGVALVAALILLFQLAQVIYRLLLVLMGGPNTELLSTETAYQLADCLIAGIVWGVHLLAIRGDGRIDKLTPHAVPTPPPAQSIEQRRQSLEQRQQILEAELEQVKQELALLPLEEKLYASDPPAAAAL